MEKTAKFRNNKLGLKGWIVGGKYGLERYAYTLHRLTGLGLLLYFVAHIFVTGARLGGPETWEATMHSMETPLFKFGEFLVYLAFAFHALNGLRLGITELGFMMGKAQRPVFPYKNSVKRQRPLLIFVMIIAAVLILLGGADFYLI
jgi:succinate dehydrogenase / fumarate reductase, cytochrome b subunit